MVDKVNGKAAAGEFLGKQLDFYTVAMTVTGADAAAVKAIVEKAVETVSINGQPIMLSGDALTATATGAVTLKFAIEHTGSWGRDGGTKLVADKDQDANVALEAALEAVAGITAVTVTLVDVL